jgi:hypothetical protein
MKDKVEGFVIADSEEKAFRDSDLISTATMDRGTLM